ncbi:aminotransferase class I/II-fold pyridoxal phosphate-dependent enzyme [Klebsiella pneumoniae]
MSHTKIANKLQNLKSSAIRELLKHSKMDGVISLGGGIPDPNLFDREGLQIAMDHILTHGWEDAFQYGLSEGNPELRAAICQIMLDRGIHCGVEDVVVTSGSQQSLDILARALINPGDVVVLERPTYLAALQVFQLAEANSQSLTSQYLHSGRLPGQIALIRKAYELKCRVLSHHLLNELGDHLTFHQPMGGMFLWAKFKYAMDTTQWLQKTIRNGVVFVPGEFFYCEEPDHCTLRMSYVSTTEENLIEAVKRLKISLN